LLLCSCLNSKMFFSTIEIIGIFGLIAFLISFFLSAFKKIKSDSYENYTINLVGGILIVIYSALKASFTFILFGSVWIIASFYGILHKLKREDKLFVRKHL